MTAPVIAPTVPSESDQRSVGLSRYVYAVVPSGTALPKPPLASACELVVHEDLAAVVSPLPAEMEVLRTLGGDEPAGHLDELATAVRVHEDVVQALLASGDVLPFRFGTVAPAPSGVTELLTAQADHFRSALARVHGRAEWALRIWFDPPDDGSSTVTAGGTGPSPGHAYLRARREQLAGARSAWERASARADRLIGEIAAIVVEQRLATAPAWAAGRGRRTRRRAVLRQVVCLVERASEDGFLGRLEELVTDFGDGFLSAEVIGPLPPYGFVALSSDEEARKYVAG